MSKPRAKDQATQDDLRAPTTTNNGAGKDGYIVGYGRPPVHTRFKQGQSGNKRGRPKGRRNIKSELREIASKKIVVRDGETKRHISLPAANLLAHGVKGAKGDARSAGLFFKILCKLFDQDDGCVGESTADPVTIAQTMRPCAPLFENIVTDLLSTDEKIELSCLAEIIDEGGDATALRTDQFDRLKFLVEKGRGNSTTE
jgi:hypothetical protein